MSRPILGATLGALVLLGCGGDAEPPAKDAGPSRSAEAVAPASTPEASSPAGGTPIEITAVVNGEELAVTGIGTCEHAADGSIYERPASLWTARYEGRDSDPIRHLNLTFWRERSGTESVTMALEVGAAVHRIATVQGGERQGSGTASLDGGADAGTLVVSGTSDAGKAITLRAKCASFTTMVAEGG